MMRILKFNLYIAILVTEVFWAMVSPSLCAASENPLLDREIEIEFNPVEGATSYEIKAKNNSDQTDTPIFFESEKPSLSKRLPLGKWSIEVRSLDRRRVPGRWQSIGELNIGFKAPSIISPKENQVIKTDPSEPALVEFQWNSFHPHAEYILKILDEKNAVVGEPQVHSTALVFYHRLPIERKAEA